MTKITENEIELFAIELLEKLGFEYIYAPSIAPDSDMPMRESFAEVILKEKLQNALTAINPTLDYVLTPGRYVGLEDVEDEFDFKERFESLRRQLKEQMAEEAQLNQRINDNLAKVVVDG